MSEIRIGKASTGEVVVIDNHPANGKYDLNERVELRSGTTTISREAVTAALKELGIPALKKGMNLDALNAYVHQLRDAKESIDDGRLYFLDSLASAARYAQEAGTPLSDAEIARMTQSGYAQVYKRNFMWAEEMADNGNIEGARDAIKHLRDSAKKGGIAVDEKQLAGLVQKSFQKGVEAALTDGEEKASQGDVDETKAFLRKALKIARAGKVVIDHNRFKAIAKKSLVEAYVNAFDLAYRYAKGEKPEYSSQSAESLVGGQISIARDYAEEAGLLFDEGHAAEITKMIVRIMLNEAKELAEIGFTKGAQDQIAAATAFAEGKDFKVDEAAVEVVQTIIASK